MRMLGVHRIHYRKGGAESVHLDHLRLFRERGWDCAEFAMAHPDNDPSPWQSYFPTNFQPEGGSLLRQVASVPRYLHSSETAAAFDRLLADFRPDVIHIHGLYHQLTASILQPARKRGIPTVFTLHDFKLVCPAYHLYNPRFGVCEKCQGGRQWNALINRCSGVSLAKDAVMALDGLVQWYTGATHNGVTGFVAPSRFLAAKMAEFGIDPAKLHYVPNFFETTDDRPVDPAFVKDLRQRHGRFVLFFGRLSREKGLDGLVRAVAGQGVPLVLVGDGPQRAELAELARTLGANVTFTGHLKGATLWSYVSAAEIVALPSIWYENAPKSLLEAQARGRIVLANAIGGLPEMVTDGVTGFLAKPGDIDDLARKIAHILALPPEEAAAIGEAGCRAAASTFTSDRYFAEMTALYERLGVRAH
jgi:glycosyltransferase involved in cell wall biosynthesis